MFYRATLTRESGGVLVEFADCPGCATYGDTEEEAIANAQEALVGWLEAHLQEGKAPPAPKARSGVVVPVGVQLSLVLQLRWLRAELGLTQAQVAKRAGVSQQQIARLEHPDANPTLEMLDRVTKSLGRVLIVLLHEPPPAVARKSTATKRRVTKAKAPPKAAHKASPKRAHAA